MMLLIELWNVVDDGPILFSSFDQAMVVYVYVGVYLMIDPTCSSFDQAMIVCVYVGVTKSMFGIWFVLGDMWVQLGDD